MRLVYCLLLLPILIGSAWADEPPKTQTHHARRTWQQHFAEANLAHDGHLTMPEAKQGFPRIAKHFEEIDVNKRGYVTEDDIRAWRALHKAAHRPADKPTPRHAFQLHAPDQPEGAGRVPRVV